MRHGSAENFSHDNVAGREVGKGAQLHTHSQQCGSNLIAAGNLCCRLRPSDLQSDVRPGTGDEAATGAGAGALSLSCCTPVASILHATGY